MRGSILYRKAKLSATNPKRRAPCGSEGVNLWIPAQCTREGGAEQARGCGGMMLGAARVALCVLAALAGGAAAQTTTTTQATVTATPEPRTISRLDYLCTKCLNRPIRASVLHPTCCIPRPTWRVLRALARARVRQQRHAWARSAVANATRMRVAVFIHSANAMENHAVGDGALVGGSCDSKDTAVPGWCVRALSHPLALMMR